MQFRRTPGRLVVLSLVALALSSSCGRPQHSDPANILLIIVDTLRADHLGCYGHEQARTPNIDALASQGAKFDQVVTSATVTAPSVASMLTSTSPCFHGVRDNELFSLNQDLQTLATVLRDAEYSCAAFVSSVVLDERYGFANGFHYYDDEMNEDYKVYDPAQATQAEELRGTQRRADKVTAAALGWLKDHENDGPFMCLVHYFDPHDPYDPPPPYDHAFRESPYDGEISFTDLQIGLLLDGLKKYRLDRNTLVVLTADHGEGLGEHRERTHGFFIYDSTVLVPLILRMPGVIEPGASFGAQVQTLDIMPTILDLVGVTVPLTAQGKSLAPALLAGEKLEDRPAYIETFRPFYSYNWHELEAVRTDRWKYVRAPESELYDLHGDPGELNNIIETEPLMASETEFELEHLQEELAVGAAALAAERLGDDPGVAKKMRALGYLGTRSSKPKERQPGSLDLPDPKSEIAA